MVVQQDLRLTARWLHIATQVIRIHSGASRLVRMRVLDATGSNGQWGDALAQFLPDATVDGIDTQQSPRPESYAHWWAGSAAQVLPKVRRRYDLVMVAASSQTSIEQVCELLPQSLQALSPRGWLLASLPRAWLTDRRYAHLWHDMIPMQVWIERARRKQPENRLGLYLWQQGSRETTILHWVEGGWSE